MAYSMEDFCSSQSIEDWHDLPMTSQQFLQNLSLPTLHPFCNTYQGTFPAAPPMGSPNISYGMIESLVTLYYFYVPPIIAFIDVWMRMLSGWTAPLGFLFLAWQCLRQRAQHPLTFCITLCSAWILMTDDQYILQFGRSVGFLLILCTLFVSHNGHVDLFFSRTIYILVILAIVYPTHMDDPQEVRKINPGLYYNDHNPIINTIAEKMAQSVPEYSKMATPWELTGDAQTGLPYLMNKVEKPHFHRVWLETIDNEYLALDIAFPSTGHDETRPIYLIFHGLNGGSDEGYVVDLAQSRIKQGSTVVVMIARGMMDTPIQGWTFSNGRRVVDAHVTAMKLKETVVQPKQTLAGVGYSLGAIVLNNYVASYGNQVALDVSVSISGSLACTVQKDFRRSQVTWQLMIAAWMKQFLLDGKYGLRLNHQLGKDRYKELMRAASIVDIDEYANVQYDGYNDLDEFYAAMSAVDPNDPFKKHIAIPHLILQAFNDPISTWRNNASNDPSSPLYPLTLVNNVQDNLVLLLTKSGGHVGWPIGLWPRSWKYMNDYVAVGFVNAYESSKGRTSSDEAWIQEKIPLAKTIDAKAMQLPSKQRAFLANVMPKYCPLTLDP